MLQSVKDLEGCELAAQDGAIGHVREVYFDDQLWVVRHLVVDTGGWLSNRRVLVSPHAVKAIARDNRRLELGLTRQQVQDAPGIETDRPVSRQYEAATYDFYGYPYYWGGSGLWGMLDMPMGGTIAPFKVPEQDVTEDARERLQAEREAADPHLRSSAEVTGYDVAARDGDIGHIHDFLFDPQTWRIEMLVVDTHNWLPDRLVLVPPRWVDSVDWSARKAVVRAVREAIENSPPYEPQRGVDREAAQTVQRHFEGMV
jgi:hypothetical protein